MKILNDITIKNLKLNKKRSVMTIIGIGLSVALVFTVISMLMSLGKVIEKSVIKERGSQHIMVVDGDPYKEKVKANREVKEYGELKVLGYAQVKAAHKYKPYLKVMAYDDNKVREIIGLTLVEGRYPQNSNELVIGENAIKDGSLKYKVGDRIKLSLGKRTIKDDEYWKALSPVLRDSGLMHEGFQEGETLENLKEKEYKIVGIIKRPNTSVENFAATGYSAFTVFDGREDYLNSILFYRLVNPKNIDKHVETLYGGDNQVFTINTALLKVTGFSFNNEYMSVFYLLAGLLIFVILLTSIMIIRNSFSISIVERTKEFGILKSLGATDRQVKKNIIFEGMSLGIVATLAGILLGFAACKVLIMLLNSLAGDIFALNGEGFKFEIYISLPTIGIAVILGLLTTLISAYLIARRSVKLTPIEAIRSSQDIKLTNKDVKAPFYINRLFGISGLVAYKNLKRNRKKYRTTIASLAMSVAVFIGMFAMTDSLNRAVRGQVSYINYNLQMDAHKDLEKNFKLFKDLGRGLDKGDEFAAYMIGYGNVKADAFTDEYKKYQKDDGFDVGPKMPVTVNVVNSESFDRLLKINGFDKSTDAIVNNNGKLTDKNKKVVTFKFFKGSEIDLNLINNQDGNSDKETRKLKIKEAVKAIPGMMEFDTLSEPNVYLREGTIKGEKYFNGASLRIAALNAAKAEKQIDASLQEKEISNLSLVNNQKYIRMINNLVTLVSIFGYGFITVISLIGLTNVFNTITGNIYSRQREFGALMSFGMSPGQLNKMCLYESMMIGTRSLFWGLPLGILISYLVNLIWAKGIIVLPYEFPVLAVLISIAVVMIVTFIIMSYSLGKIRSRNIIEVIRSENI